MNGHSESWNGIKYFHPDSKVDQWGDTHKISRILLEELDAFRALIGVPVIVTSGYREPKHGTNSDTQHAYGNAADIVFPDFKFTLMDAYLIASRFNFSGIGVYRDWHFPTKDHVIGGLHLDVRHPASYRAQWFCYKDHEGVQQYIELSMDNLKKYGVI